MKIYYADDYQKYCYDVVEWCDSEGNLVFQNKRDLDERELPAELREVHKRLPAMSMVQYNGSFWLRITKEYHDGDYGYSREGLWLLASREADKLKGEVLLSEYCDARPYHELTLLLPTWSNEDEIQRCLNVLKIDERGEHNEI